MVFRMRKFIYTADNNIVGLFMSPKFSSSFLAKPTYMKHNNINAKTHTGVKTMLTGQTIIRVKDLI